MRINFVDGIFVAWKKPELFHSLRIQPCWKRIEYSDFHHHEDSKSFQEKFAKHSSSLAKKFNQLGNPFEPDESKETIWLSIKDAMGDDVVLTVTQIKEIGKKQT